MVADPTAFQVLAGLAGLLALLAIVAAMRGMPRWRHRWRIPDPLPWNHGIPSEDGATDAPSADQIYFDTAQRQLDNQFATTDKYDGEALQLVQSGAIVLPVAFGLLAISERRVPVLSLWLFGASLACLLVLLVCVGRASRIRALDFRPELTLVWQHSQAVNGRTLRR